MDITKAKIFITVAMEALRDAKEIPAGHLYAALMTQGCTLDQYNMIEKTLVNYFGIGKQGFLLKWTEAAEMIVTAAKNKSAERKKA